jgi:predicted NUDIX family phosphoesterase
MQILVVPKEDCFSELSSFNSSSNFLDFTSISDFLKYVNKKGFFLERELAEKDFNYLQIIPYILVYNKDSLFLYKRLKKGNEERLHDKFSAGIGGHVDYVTNTISNKETVIYNANKELFEELDIELNTDYLDIKHTDKIIYDDSNEVGKVHIGLLMTCDTIGRGVVVKEQDKIEGRFYTPEEIKQHYSLYGEDAFETWTTIALKHVGIID